MSLLSFSLPFFGVSRKHRITFYTQLEHMLDAGLPPVRCLRTIAEHTQSSKLQNALLDMANHIERGGSLGSALERHPQIFPPLERRTIEAAETGGFSSQAIASLSSHQADMRNLWIQFWINMIYPGMILFTAMVVCPLLQALFLGGVENLVQSLVQSAIRALIILIGLLILFRFLLSNSFTRSILHSIGLKLPFLGKIVHKFAKTRFAKTLAKLHTAGLPVREAYYSSARSSGNEVVTRRLLHAATVLDEGGNLSQTIAYSGQFDAVALGLISTGEETGKLDEMLNNYADYEEQEAKVQLKIFTKMFAMMIYFLVAAYAVYIVLSFYLKLFSAFK